MKSYVFGYGSLMNPKSIRKTLPGERAVEPARLLGYQRKINAPVDGYLYLNIVPRAEKKVEGVIIPVTDKELQQLKKREVGYGCVDISNSLERRKRRNTYTFIAPDRSYPNLQIPRSYLLTCLLGKSSTDRQQWLAETIIENEIKEDTKTPVYANAALE